MPFDSDSQPLHKMPEFEAEVVEIDAETLAQMSVVNRAMYTHMTALRRDISIIRQEIRWVAETSIKAHNMAIQHDRLMEDTKRSILGVPFRIVALIGTAVIGAASVKLVDAITEKKEDRSTSSYYEDTLTPDYMYQKVKKPQGKED
jgi:hypothetical protein